MHKSEFLLRLSLTTSSPKAIMRSFNGRYLMEFARPTAAQSYAIRYNDSGIKIAATIADGSSVRYILMPYLGEELSNQTVRSAY